MSFVNRRRSSRYVVTERIFVMIDDRKGLETGTLVNVSRDGCYIATSAVLSSGERVTVVVHISESYSLRLACMVAWCNTGQVSTIGEGHGFEFMHDPRTRENAQRMIQALEARNALIELP